MKRLVRNLATTAVAAIAFAPAGARAQWYSSYPQTTAYGAQQPYAVEVSPGTYVIHRPATARRRAERAPAEKARARVHNDPVLIEQLRKRSHGKRDEKHRAADKVVAGRVKVVREKPVVVVHKRVVDDPPRVILREHVVTDLPRGRGLFQPPPRQVVQDLPPVVEQAPAPLPPSWHREYRHAEAHKVRRVEHRKAARHVETRKAIVRSELGSKRTIHAEAEVTILGPDRMTIRLFRKGSAAKAEAPAD
jgi:hypothetical protein